MSKQTAVNWLIDKIYFNQVEVNRELLDQALEMEKEQIETAYDCGYDDGKDEANGNGFFFDGKADYYNQTFNK